MIKFYLLGIILFLNSCSALPRVRQQQKGIDPTFKPYIESYRNIIGKDNHKHKFSRLSMNFKKLESGTVGKCWWLLNGDFEIEIDPDWWYQYYTFDPIARELLAYHELEHCIRYRMHTNRKKEINNIADFFEEIGYYLGLIEKPGYLKDGCPASLMHSHIMSYDCRKKHYYYYIQELKKWKD